MSPLGEGFSDTVNVPRISLSPPPPQLKVHCRGDMVVRIHKVLAIPRSWYVCFCA